MPSPWRRVRAHRDDGITEGRKLERVFGLLLFDGRVWSSSSLLTEWTRLVLPPHASPAQHPLHRPRLESLLTHRPRDEIPLHHIAPELLEQIPVGTLLHALRYAVHLQAPREREARLHDRPLRRVASASV